MSGLLSTFDEIYENLNEVIQEVPSTTVSQFGVLFH
jgi:hypothetical protein